jgi:MFS transporter, Spinster family, sphingosine-1-phosphate transporter
MTTPARTGYGLLALLTALNVLNFADRYLMAAFGHSIMRDLSLSNFEFTLLTGLVFSVFYVLFGLLAGSLADRFNRPRLIAAGIALWSALTAATGLAMNFMQAALARVFIGIGEAVLTPASLSMLSDRLPPQRRALAAAVYYLGIPIGIGSAYVFAGVMGPALGWRGTFLVLGGVGLLGALAVLLLRDPPRGGAEPLAAEALPIGSFRDSAAGLARVLRRSPVLGLTLIGGAATIFVQGGAILDVVWWVREHGYTEERAQAITGALFLVGGVIGAVLGGVGADLAYRRSPGGRLLFLAAVYLAVLPIGIVYRLVPMDPALFYACAFVLSASFMVPYGAMFSTVQEVVPVNLRGAAVALLILFNTLLGQAGGSALAGYLIDAFAAQGIARPMTWGLFVAGLPGLVAIPAFWWAGRILARKP